MNTKMDMDFKIKTVSDSGEFEGYGSVFNVKDSYDDIVVKGAFVSSLKERMPALLWQHKSDEPIGVYTEVREDENGLYVKGKLLINDDPLAKRAFAHLKAGSITGLSIGYRMKSWDYDKSQDALLLKEVDLYEVSLVTFPANESARISNVKSVLAKGEIPLPKELERILRDAGLSRNQAKALMAKGYTALNQREAGTDVISLIDNIFGE